MKDASKEKLRPSQSQQRPGTEDLMVPKPQSTPRTYPKGKLADKTVLITGADSGIGKAVALLFAREGARLVICYLNEKQDAARTKRQIEEEAGQCVLIEADISKEQECQRVIDETMQAFGSLDVLINNAGVQWVQEELESISTDQFLKTFQTNFFSCFWLTRFALVHMKKGGSIVNTTSVTAYRGSDHLIDYAATKAAIVGFTRSLAQNLAAKGIRVNAVAPGPVWTPLIVSSFKGEEVQTFGSDTPIGRAGQPNEIAPCYLFLASEDASYMTGQVLHPNGGEIING
ncbi:SDR family oxidoreductase [Niabella terrae]